MKCSGCGKKIPFAGEVCPFCQRDKTEDKRQHSTLTFFIILGMGIGYPFSHFFIGGLVGGFIGIVALIIGKTPKSLPPEVPLAKTANASTSITAKPPASPDIKGRLAQLDALKSDGLISDAEYTEKRQNILSLV